MPRGVLLLPLPSLFGSASLRFFLGGLGFAPKEEKPMAAAMSSGGEGEREGMGRGSGMLVGSLGSMTGQRGLKRIGGGEENGGLQRVVG